MPVLLGPCRRQVCVVYVDGPLRVPLTHDLRHSVKALLRRGDANIVLDLSRVSRVDAAGIGELVRVYNMAAAANGLLQIVQPTPWVRDVLARVRLLDILSGGTL
jgi:anti-anti-sigma factor